MALCVAVIDKDSGPLLVECAQCSTSAEASNAEEATAATKERTLALHYFVHSALDVIDEKLGPAALVGAGGRTTEIRELYLGTLVANEQYKAFGYATNTRIKFVIVITADNTMVKDQDVRAICKRLHTALCDAIANPFYTPGCPIQSNAASLRINIKEKIDLARPNQKFKTFLVELRVELSTTTSTFLV